MSLHISVSTTSKQKLHAKSYKVNQIEDTNLKKCDTASSLRSSSLALSTPTDGRQVLASLLLGNKVAQTLVQLPSRGGEGCWAGQTADWRSGTANSRAVCPPAASCLTNQSLPVWAFNNNGLSSNKGHLLRLAEHSTSHTHPELSQQSDFNT